MTSTTVSMEIDQEVRFAVVLYGGVSLAIYINGVSQELFRLVRATAVHPTKRNEPLHKDLRGTEKVYRRLGQMLGYDVADGAEPALDAPVRTRFVVDILSGTSAGGINAIYLAKALANDQDFGALQTLWYDEGDIARLINDAESFEGVPKVQAPQHPASLLNSKRMYYKLFAAFQGMETSRPCTTEPRSPYVDDDLDLFVTATDLRGVPIALRLADGVVPESRHRKVFRLRYSAAERRNDFVAANDAFLAYVARCTSSFPFAFEPMRLIDIKPFADVDPRWAAFFPEDAQHYDQRPFADGGYLDNKPFSYAIDALSAHAAAVPVDRKLLYVEPSPEHPEDAAPNFDPPNAIENVLAFDMLSHDETIHEDLQRILARNRLLERVDRVLSGMEHDLALRVLPPWMSGDKFAQTDLQEKIKQEGIAYGGYHRLKVSALTEWVSQLVGRAAGIDLESDDFVAVRYLMRAWRNDHYAPFAGPLPTENAFLLDYDLPYRVRRLEFVLQRMDQLACLDRAARERLDRIGVRSAEVSPEPFRSELQALRNQLADVIAKLRRAEEDLASAADFRGAVAATNLTILDIRTILSAPTDNDRMETAHRLITETSRASAFTTIAQTLAAAISRVTKQAAQQCDTILAEPGGAALTVARHYYFNYERYDLIAFPILYATDVGEEHDTVEVIRISPEDAKSLVDERRSSREKLAGTSLMHFGAFLDRAWRKNDLLWGRLDGAERLITTLLAGTQYAPAVRDQLVHDAQVAILEEHFAASDKNEFSRVFTDAVVHVNTADTSTQALRRYAEQQLGSHLKDTVQTAFRAAMDPEQIRGFFRDAYTVDRTMSPESAVRDLARSTQVVGQMLEGIAEKNGVNPQPAIWVARLGRIFWGLVEVSVPRSLPNLLFQHALKLLYLFEVLLVVVGLLFVSKEVQQIGAAALAATLAIHLVTLLLADVIRSRKRWVLLLRGLLAAAVVVLVAGEGYHLITLASGSFDAMHDLSLQADTRFMATVAGAIAAMMAIAGALLAVLGRIIGPKERPRLPKGIVLPGLALELAEGPEEVAAIAGPIDGPVRDALRTQTDTDFCVIASYWLLLMALSGFSASLGTTPGLWLGVAAATGTTAAALFDVIENLRTYALLDARADVVARLAAMREATRFKWGALFTTMALLGGSMLWSPPWPLRTLGAWFVLTAVVGGSGVARHSRAIQTGFLMMLAAFVGVAGAFAVWPQVFLVGL